MHEQHYFSYLQHEKRNSSLTISAYRNDIESFVAFCRRTNPVFELENTVSQQVRSWVIDLMESGLKASSVNRKISALKSVFRYFQKNNFIADNPAKRVISPKKVKSLPGFVDQHGMDQFNSETVFSDSFSGWRDRVVVELFYQTGMRRAELLNLKLSDLDNFTRTIKVLGKRNKERLIPASLDLFQALNTYIGWRSEVAKPDAGNVLILTDNGMPAYAKFIYRLVNRYLSLVTLMEKRSPHVLRHTFATHLLNNGAELNSIKELLGHVNLAATQVYTHTSFEKLNKIYKQAHPRA